VKHIRNNEADSRVSYSTCRMRASVITRHMFQPQSSSVQIVLSTYEPCNSKAFLHRRDTDGIIHNVPLRGLYGSEVRWTWGPWGGQWQSVSPMKRTAHIHEEMWGKHSNTMKLQKYLGLYSKALRKFRILSLNESYGICLNLLSKYRITQDCQLQSMILWFIETCVLCYVYKNSGFLHDNGHPHSGAHT
jgi:hypothetical protein